MKYLYYNTRTIKVRTVHAIGLLTWILVVLGFMGAIITDPFYTYIMGPILAVMTLYHVLSYGMAMTYRRPSMIVHSLQSNAYWKNRPEPSVDVFLPVCGEDLGTLTRTWQAVATLDYKNVNVYVLDDSTKETTEHREIAERFGFTYLERPNKGWMKKAGNLRYGFDRSNGEFIVIFDADFAPSPDFITELLPYMNDNNVGIVQSPQYFRYDNSFAAGAARVQEAFYRYIQVARDRFNGTICCGSNAIYRRAALDTIGGTALIEHSEDAWTGFKLASKGWRIKYVPLILAVGECPSDPHQFYHQQHRWAMGSMSLVGSREFWVSPLPVMTKLCYLMGFLYYVVHPLSIIFSLQLFWTLWFYSDYVSLSNGLLFYPYAAWSFYMLLGFPLQKFELGHFRPMMVQLYAYSHAVWTKITAGAVGWIPTNTKQGSVSRAFAQGYWFAATILGINAGLAAAMIITGKLDLLDPDCYSVGFWVIYNIALSLVVVLTFSRTVSDRHNTHV